MKRTMPTTNGEQKSMYISQEALNFGYDNAYANYPATSQASTISQQPLPGQPPLPPMPPPTAAVPPPPHVFAQVPQVAQLQTWTHQPPPWQWITPAATLTTPANQKIGIAATFQQNASVRGNYMRRERFTSNRNNVYQRGNYHNRHRRQQNMYEQSQDHAMYFGTALQTNIGLDWQRNNYGAAAGTESLISRMQVPVATQLQLSLPHGLNTKRHHPDADEERESEVKIAEEVVVKKNKQRKPMSQSYPSRPWNRQDAERAIEVEKEFNKAVRAQSLIIKFPDPDLNKDVVRKFHPGIQNIHFQSPSGPRYCFIQMATNVNIDEAIEQLEKIPFGVGTLKVERKSLRDEDNPTPEEIDPYTLYIGNLPESVNVNEVKSKFPSAARVDVGFAQKMRNTRYAFIRYNSITDSIAAYIQAHDLMWDTRSIIVRFRRQRGNTCLPGEPKPNAKKAKEDQAKDNSTREKQSSATATTTSNTLSSSEKVPVEIPQQNNVSSTVQSSKPQQTAGEARDKKAQQEQMQISTSQASVASEAPSDTEKWDLIEIKEEPEDYEEMDSDLDDDDDPNSEESQEENENNDESEEEEESEDETPFVFNGDTTTANEPSDHLDQMFNDLENMASDIGL